YQALGSGKSIPDAYEMACAQIAMVDASSQTLGPILITKKVRGRVTRTNAVESVHENQRSPAEPPSASSSYRTIFKSDRVSRVLRGRRWLWTAATIGLTLCAFGLARHRGWFRTDMRSKYPPQVYEQPVPSARLDVLEYKVAPIITPKKAG